MSETKSRCTILGCRYPNKHSTAAHVEHDAYCSHPTDPRIAAADAMAKALESIKGSFGDDDHLREWVARQSNQDGSKLGFFLTADVITSMMAALAAYNALK